MKWSFGNVGLIGLGLVVLTILFLFGILTLNNEQDYYGLKEAAKAAMIESIDIAYYRETGELKMSQEKFTENFTRRFAESTNLGTSEYNIIFSDIVERPPKVSIRIVTSTGEFDILGTSDDYDIVNEINAILAYSPTGNVTDVSEDTPHEWVTKQMRVRFFSIPYGSASNHDFGGAYVTDNMKKFIPEELNECVRSDIRNVKYVGVENIKKMSSQAEIDYYVHNFSETFDYTPMGYEYKMEDLKIRYFAESLTVSPSNFIIVDNRTDMEIEDGSVYDCSISGNDTVKAVIKWAPTYYNCGNNVNPKVTFANGAIGYNTCLFGITFDVIFEYEQYE